MFSILFALLCLSVAISLSLDLVGFRYDKAPLWQSRTVLILCLPALLLAVISVAIYEDLYVGRSFRDFIETFLEFFGDVRTTWNGKWRRV